MREIDRLPYYRLPQLLTLNSEEMAQAERSMLVCGFEYRHSTPFLARQFLTNIRYDQLPPLK